MASKQSRSLERGDVPEWCRKVAVLSATANGDREISFECVTAALELMKWQQRLKSVFRIGNALERSLDAQFCDTALAAMQQAGAEQRSVSWKRLAHDRKWVRRFGASIVNRGLTELVSQAKSFLMRIDTATSSSTTRIWRSERCVPAAERLLRELLAGEMPVVGITLPHLSCS